MTPRIPKTRIHKVGNYWAVTYWRGHHPYIYTGFHTWEEALRWALIWAARGGK